tara:strand:- start:1057 stop:1794 length:738 start_codon:yes stop_codon:yes gene_type:complete
MEIFLDTREHTLINFFTEHKLPFKTKNLDVGDFQILKDGIPNIIIERKSLKDLSASIKDGRYKEQKIRLAATNPNKHNIVFLIEGSFFSYKSRWTLPKSTILSSLVNTLFRDGFSIIRTQSFNETCEYLAKITKTAINSPEKLLLKEISNDYKTTIQVKKKLNITPEICFYTQLITIPKISKQIATYLVDKFGCFIELCKYYESTNSDEREMLFANDLIKTSTGKTRKIGKVASKSLYQFIYCKK